MVRAPARERLPGGVTGVMLCPRPDLGPLPSHQVLCTRLSTRHSAALYHPAVPVEGQGPWLLLAAPTAGSGHLSQGTSTRIGPRLAHSWHFVGSDGASVGRKGPLDYLCREKQVWPVEAAVLVMLTAQGCCDRA